MFNSQGDCPNRPLSLSDKQNFGRPTLNHQRRPPESLFPLYHAFIDNRLCPSRLGKVQDLRALLAWAPLRKSDARRNLLFALAVPSIELRSMVFTLVKARIYSALHSLNQTIHHKTIQFIPNVWQSRQICVILRLKTLIGIIAIWTYWFFQEVLGKAAIRICWWRHSSKEPRRSIM